MREDLSRRLFLSRTMSAGAGAYATFLLAGCSSQSNPVPAASPPVHTMPPPEKAPAAKVAPDWKRLRLGAGGFVTGISIARDGTKVVSTDTHNGYLWDNQQKRWKELFTRKTLPKGDVPFPTYSGPQSDGGKSDGPGCWAVAVASSNSSVIYGVWNAWCYRSIDRGQTFEKTSLPRIHARANDQNFAGAERLMGPKMAIDPANANVVWLSGDMADGIWVTQDGGGTWGKKSGIPEPTDVSGSPTNRGPYLIVFDPSSPVVGGRTQGVYVASFGNGLFRSVDGGSTFEQVAGAPTSFRRVTCDQQGRVWICDTSTYIQPIRKYEKGAWTAYGNSNVRLIDVAVNPANPAHILAWSNGLAVLQSKDNGQTWQHFYGHSDPSLTKIVAKADDIPWLASSVNAAGLSIGGASFDPTTGSCFIASGLGVFVVQEYPDTTATKLELKSQSLGIEQLCVWRILAPPGGSPLTAQLDRSAMKIADPDIPPNTYGPSSDLKDGFDLDYSGAEPSFVVALCVKNGNFSGFSRDYGATWNYFQGRSQMSPAPGGSMSVGAVNNILHFPSNNGVARWSNDGGASWQPVAINGLPKSDGSETGWGWAWYFNRKILCADKMIPGTFYAYNYGPSGKAELAGLWKTSDGGSNWTRVKEGTIGQWTSYHAQLNSVPGSSGHLFFTAGREQRQPLYRSTDGGAGWSEVAGVRNVISFGFGRPKEKGEYPAVYIAGEVAGAYGIWRSDDSCASWKQIGEHPLDGIDAPVALAGDPNIFGRCYVAFGGSGAAYIDSGET